jgi:serine protease Do
MVYFHKLLKFSVIPMMIAWKNPVLLNSDYLTTADVCEKVLPSVFRIISKHPATYDVQGVGSGFFIKKDGTGLTAHHVLYPKSILIAKLDSGEECPIEILNSHPLTDIALVKVKVQNPVPYLNLGNSDLNRRGEQVVQFGNTIFGTSTEISVGYINKLKDDMPKWVEIQTNENLESSRSGIKYIMTSGSVRPGFSGGPLVNMKGEVIGLISRLYIKAQSNLQDSEGASIPINIVKGVIKQMEISGTVKRPYLGISVSINYPGLAIVNVQNGSPAQKYGLKVGDIILSVNGKPINSSEDLFSEIGFKIGVILELKILRNTEEIFIKLYT